MNLRAPIAALCMLSLLSGCDSLREKPPLSEGHIDTAPAEEKDESTAAIPDPVYVAPSLPAPAPTEMETTHTVVVYDVPVTELLFSLARDSELNLDIDSEIDARITLNAVDQPLSPLLDRITQSAGLRYEIRDNVLEVRRDLPFLRTYEVEYLNMSRTSTGAVEVSTEISSTGVGAGEEGGGSASNNNSDTTVNNTSQHAFWDTLYQNIDNIIYNPTEAELGTDDRNRNIVMNRESGVIAVRATSRQHAEVSRFIDSVQRSSQRQVLIEATVAEVKLSEGYQAGIDWQLLDEGADLFIDQAVTDPLFGLAPRHSRLRHRTSTSAMPISRPR